MTNRKLFGLEVTYAWAVIDTSLHYCQLRMKLFLLVLKWPHINSAVALYGRKILNLYDNENQGNLNYWKVSTKFLPKLRIRYFKAILPIYISKTTLEFRAWNRNVVSVWYTDHEPLLHFIFLIIIFNMRHSSVPLLTWEHLFHFSIFLFWRS